MPLVSTVPERDEVKLVHEQVHGEIRVAQDFIQNFPENKTHDFMRFPKGAETGQVGFIRKLNRKCPCFCISGLLGWKRCSRNFLGIFGNLFGRVAVQRSKLVEI